MKYQIIYNDFTTLEEDNINVHTIFDVIKYNKHIDFKNINRVNFNGNYYWFNSKILSGEEVVSLTTLIPVFVKKVMELPLNQLHIVNDKKTIVLQTLHEHILKKSIFIDI